MSHASGGPFELTPSTLGAGADHRPSRHRRGDDTPSSEAMGIVASSRRQHGVVPRHRVSAVSAQSALGHRHGDDSWADVGTHHRPELAHRDGSAARKSRFQR